ncbi:transcriptional regulator [Duganella sp. FT50W]|uniref:Transcriptional regulator n=1 Tax=Duganella lactea TaxID=2692173 RepID=A0A6L8MPW8_9BURK|nr:transcriptional regulator [Duganella lactea]MYM81788.1 transcriptional regulator [Duganella lactea]
MPTNEEKAAFAQRLVLALRRSPEPVSGPTELALRFNLRFGGDPVSAQTAHNWLAGRTIPTDDKLLILAKWLKVDQHWLHYGDSPTKRASTKGQSDKKIAAKPSPETIRLAVKIQNMPARWRYLVEELVDRVDQDLE